ncbi:MAG: hypothetical protein ABI024_02790, partial [Vicinamibacterales bacterium]
QGTMQIVGGCGEAVTGAYAVAQTGGLAAVPGWVAFAHGSDVCGAGFRTLWTGQIQESFTKQGAQAGMIAAGVDPGSAHVASSYIDLGLSAYGTIGSNGRKIETPEPHRNNTQPIATNDSVAASETYDANGQYRGSRSSGGTDRDSAGAENAVTYIVNGHLRLTPLRPRELTPLRGAMVKRRS